MASFKIKKGDRVVVLSGRDKGKRGEVIQVMPTEMGSAIMTSRLMEPIRKVGTRMAMAQVIWMR